MVSESLDFKSISGHVLSFFVFNNSALMRFCFVVYRFHVTRIEYARAGRIITVACDRVLTVLLQWPRGGKGSFSIG